MADGALDRLADLAGIETRYREEGGAMRDITPAAKRGVLSALGFDVSGDEAIQLELEQCERVRWAGLAPPVVVFHDAEMAEIPLALPVELTGARLAWDFVEEHGRRETGETTVADLETIEVADVQGRRYERRVLVLPLSPPAGYHQLRLEIGGLAHELQLIVSHGRCFLPPSLSRGSGLWGIAAQLYALRTERDWGIGDFSALEEFIDLAADLGASAVGLNPLHALSLHHPERASPYSPSSRVLINALYLDVERVAGFSAAIPREITALRAKERVDYKGVAAAKLAALRHIYSTGGAPTDAFRHFQAAGGQQLRRWALFEALSAHFSEAPTWRQWPEDYRDPDSGEVASFAGAHETEVEFFEWLQWQADTQLAGAAARCGNRGLAIGLYHDLALGADHDSADVWGSGDLYSAKASIGAPPDIMNLRGQNWGIAPMNPHALKRRAYQPLISVLHAGMRTGGALRIDHAMSLQRLFWIPEGGEPKDGAYVRQPMEDLIGVLALESHRRRCIIIGEDLGTVARGFRARMERARVLSYRPLFFQRDEAGKFLPPADYPRLSMAVVGTHDMPTLSGYWSGRDLEVRRALGLNEQSLSAADEAAEREREKRLLLAALAEAGFAAESEEGIALAAHEFLAVSPSRLVMARLEDVLGESEQHNLPGTTIEHPNWNLRFEQTVKGLAADPRIRKLAEQFQRTRATPAPHLQRHAGGFG
jgi:(1->4)-alpha-D-glucan 1-alpha-D-glucosylmutase